MKENRALAHWGAFCALVSGLAMTVPLIFYFYVLPQAGSNATHAADPASFLPWMAEKGTPRVALWWIVAAAFALILLGMPVGLRDRLAGRRGRDTPAPQIEAAAWVAERAGVIGCASIVVTCLALTAGTVYSFKVPGTPNQAPGTYHP